MLKIKKILFPTDFSNCSKQAFAHALFLAKKYGAELHILHVITIHAGDIYDPKYDFPHLEEYNVNLEKHATQRSDNLINEHIIGTTRIISIQKRGYAPSAIILGYANENAIDMIVMGTHGRHGLGYLFLGSIAEEVTRFAKRPVYTIREQKNPKPIDKINRILVPLDLSDRSQEALYYANEFCRDYHADLEILHVIEERIHPAFYATAKSSIIDILPNVKDKSLSLINGIWDKISEPKAKINIKILVGSVAREILRHAGKNNFDLIVLTTHGASGLDQFLLGSIAEKVIRRSICPVFIVKSFGKRLFAENGEDK